MKVDLIYRNFLGKSYVDIYFWFFTEIMLFVDQYSIYSILFETKQDRFDKE